MAREEGEACLQLFVIRNGKMIGREHFIVENARDATDGDVLGIFLQQYYAATERPPRDVLLPLQPSDADVAVGVPRRAPRLPGGARSPGARGEAAAGALATQNAVEALAKERAEWLADEGKRDEALDALADALSLARPPERIECYDMSNIQGTSAVGSMVVFVNGRPDPREYRRFRIRSGETPDDFRMMAEVLRRRFSGRRGCGRRRAPSPWRRWAPTRRRRTDHRSPRPMAAPPRPVTTGGRCPTSSSSTGGRASSRRPCTS